MELVATENAKNEEKIELPFRNQEEFCKIMDESKSLIVYLQQFEYTTAVMQSVANIRRVAFELAEDAHLENVKYIEVRFCPQLHTRKGLTLHDVVHAVLDGLNDARTRLGILSNVIICSMRSDGIEHSNEMSALAVDFANNAYEESGFRTKVVAFDLAGDEGYSATIHRDACTKIRENNMSITIHAGEANGSSSIAEAIHICGAKRIGHGVRLQDDKRLLDYVNDSRITLECCPTSNAQTHAVASLGEHPIKAYLDQGIRVTVNTDNRLMSHTTVSKELFICHTQIGLTEDDIRKVIVNGFKSSFLPIQKKRSMISAATDEIRRLFDAAEIACSDVATSTLKTSRSDSTELDI